MPEPIPAQLSEHIDAGVRAAIAEAIERHRRARRIDEERGESISILKDGQIITLRTDQIPIKPAKS